MEFEFDKEIDAILRKARGSEAVGVFDSHLDADDISAFAENVLPQKTRQNYTAHLAECLRCRQILSNVIAFNSAEAETNSSAVAPPIVAETSIPWYRRLFAMPNLAYTMGALVLIFGGFLGFLVLQNFDNSMNSAVSISSNKAMPDAAPNFPSESSSANANSSSPMANTSTNSAVTTTTNTNSAPVFSSNSTANRSVADSSETKPEALATPPIPTAEQQEDKESAKQNNEPRELAKTTPAPTVNQPVTGGVVREEKNKSQNDKDEKMADSSAATEDDSTKLKTTRSMPNPAKKADSPTESTRQVGRKTFKKIGGTWFDSDYGTQKQISVKRGTNQYRNLDSGLRSIADQFSGTVVILWKSKAYRIQ